NAAVPALPPRPTRGAPVVVEANTTARATRALKAPVIDGRDDDDVWRGIVPITAFRQFEPVEDGEPPMATEAKVAFDNSYFYVFVRAYDPHPDSIRSYLSRRDVATASDQILVLVDSYHDRRTGYQFMVNPAGVKVDQSMSEDGAEDPSWDGVWEAATSIDAKGWTAEFRIPLSQLRYAKSENQLFGFAVARLIARQNIKVSWPLIRHSKTGFVSQMGELSGLDHLGDSRRLEVTPYAVAKDQPVALAAGGLARSSRMTAGADLKVGLTSNLTVDATINPDFGQVEADPSVLNLTSFEQFYQERRPFFLEGAGIFRYNLDCSDNRCSGLFYSRRIGRAPQLSDQYGDASTKQNTNILAAAKLTGRLANGLSIGILDAATERVTGPLGQTVEPQTNYVVGRLNQDFRGGNSTIGVMFTGVNRQLDRWSEDVLRRSAYVIGIDGRHRFGANNYEVEGHFAQSHVEGSAAAITATQLSSVHNLQRLGAGLSLDSSRTGLSGTVAVLGVSKTGGGSLRWWTGYKRTSAGFEINDAGFQTRADVQSWNGWMGLNSLTSTSWYDKANVNFNSNLRWNLEGMGTGVGASFDGHVVFKNQWKVDAGYNAFNLGNSWDDRIARGGPAMLQLAGQSAWAGVQMDERWAVSPALYVSATAKNAAGSWRYGIDQFTMLRLASNVQAHLGGSFVRSADDAQWNGNFSDASGTHFTFAHLEQTVTSLTARLDVTATPTVSIQLYASPFMTSGQYSNWREVSNPHAAVYADQFTPFTSQGDPGGFNFKQFRSNAVIRWEYLPGSTLFVVWTQGRQQDGVDSGSFEFGRDTGNLFRARPENTVLVKSSYWFNW
ncbi:MAG: DUF5916 domain-containing protein, partial [Gemmatimonadetes bacterium]|nr:DUF5916 domain-containing protein [Gemmatimonadota bacterium]